MQRTTPEFVQSIFYSGQFGFVGDLEMIARICFLINENYLSLRPIIIATKIQYLDTAANKTIISANDEASGGGNEHIALKLLAAAYLKQEYGVDSVFEQSFVGFVPDVQSKDMRIICECGHTNNPEKIFTYLKHPQVHSVIQIPYPSEQDTHVTGYAFKAQKNLFSFLDFETQGKNQTLKDILNNRRR